MRDVFQSRAAASWPLSYGAAVQLLLHADGASGSTTITDSSAYARSVTALGSAALSTTQARFGSTSISLPTAASRATVPTAAAWNLGTAPFTLELWVYFSSVAGGTGILHVGAANFYGAALVLASTGALTYYVSSGGTSWDVASAVSVGTVATGQWYHVALVRDGSVFSPFLNGVRGTQTTSAAAVFGSSNTVTVGYPVGLSATGFYDEVRLSTGRAWYSGASFTPPAAAFLNP
jgi:hypothetical protein